MPAVVSTLPRRRGYMLDALAKFSEDQVFSATADGTNVLSISLEDLQTHNLVLEHGAISSVTPGSAEWTMTLVAGSTVILTQVLGATAKRYNFVFDGLQLKDVAGTQTALKIRLTKAGSVGNVTVTSFICPQQF